MAGMFDRKMFIMLISIMIGAITVTYFIADIVNQSKMEELTFEYTTEIETIEEKSINFISILLESLILLDSSREDRAFGNYHFDIASIFYYQALTEDDISKMETDKNITIDNCTKAMLKYSISNLNFKSTSDLFNNAKKYTDYNNYLKLIDIYINLTESGEKLTMLRYNSSNYLRQLAENLTFVNGSATSGNVSILLTLFNESMRMYEEELAIYEEYEEKVDEYSIEGFRQKREPT